VVRLVVVNLIERKDFHVLRKLEFVSFRSKVKMFKDQTPQ
jgi:hypothetical protein